MAINPVKLLTAANATATNGSVTISLTGSVDASRIYQGTVIHIGGFTPVEALSGTPPDQSGNSTITLRDPWPETSTTDRLVAFNTIEGLTGAIEKARDVVEQTSGLEEVSGNGLLEKTGENTYDIAPFTTQGRNLVGDVTASEQRDTLGLGTGATKDIQTSSTDTTAGRLMTVGAFGLGNNSFFEYPSTDLDDRTVPTGFYRVINTNPSTGERPSGFNIYGYVQVYSYDPDDKLQVYTDINGRTATRVLKTTGKSDWQEHYHSGNSVNPLDLGLGSNGDNVDLPNWDLTKGTAGFYESGSNNVIVMSRTASRSTALLMHAGGQSSNDPAFNLSFSHYDSVAGTEFGRVDVYHSGNSVNPLDYGLGGIAPTIASNDFHNLPDKSGIFASDGSLVNGPTATGNYMTLSMVRSETGDNFNSFGSLLSIHRDNGSAYVGGMNETKNPQITWNELYHSGNTNFNEFVGGRCLSSGFAKTATTARFYFPLNSMVTPSGISISAPADFELKTSTGATIADATAIVFTTISSSKLGVIDVTIGSSLMTQGDSVELRGNSANTSLIFNF